MKTREEIQAKIEKKARTSYIVSHIRLWCSLIMVSVTDNYIGKWFWIGSAVLWIVHISYLYFKHELE